MGIIKVITKAQADNMYLANALLYVTGKHTIPGMYGGININPDNAFYQMMAVKEYFCKTGGNPLVHFIVCFDANHSNEVSAFNMCYKIAEYYNRYQIVFGLHNDIRKNKHGKVVTYFHAHFILNSVSFTDGRKYADNRGEIQLFINHIKNVTGNRKWRVRYGSNAEIDYDDMEAV